MRYAWGDFIEDKNAVPNLRLAEPLETLSERRSLPVRRPSRALQAGG